MKFYLQFGHGMMKFCRDIFPDMPESGVILSPRDLNEKQIEKLGGDIVKMGSTTLLDPQIYNLKSNHPTLTEHKYWPGENSVEKLDYDNILSELKILNDKAQTSAFILPGFYSSKMTDSWLNTHDSLVDVAIRILNPGRKMGTLCLAPEMMRMEQLDQLLTKTEEWKLDGYYIIPVHPDGEYLVENPVWLSRLLYFCSGLKLQNKEVILGYSNHQMLACACAKIDGLATGTWMNLRSFTLDRFDKSSPDSIKRKSKWYYCPQALTEIKLEFLDVAFEKSILKALASLPEYNSQHAAKLFSGAIPTTTACSESELFKHYLCCLHGQCKVASKASFEETIDYQRELLIKARKVIGFMHKHGVRGQQRDFEDFIDVNLSAIDLFEADNGFLFKRRWDDLPPSPKSAGGAQLPCRQRKH